MAYQIKHYNYRNTKINYSTLPKIKPDFVLTKLDFKFTKSDFNFIKQGFANTLL